MASERMNLYDSDYLGWFRVSTMADIDDLKSKLTASEAKLINSEHGLHGIRIWNDKLQQTTDQGVTWTDITTGGSSIAVDDNLLSDSSVNALSAKQGKVLDGKITTLKTTVDANTAAIATKANNTLATDTDDGLFSSAEKIKLASLTPGGNTVTVEDSLTSTSTANALSANMGKQLNDELTTLEAFVNDNVVVGGVAVTQTEKDSWSAKSNFSGSYTDLTNKPDIPTLNDTLESTSTTEGLTANQGSVLNGKLTTLKTSVDSMNVALASKADKTLATDTTDGLFSSAEKIKLASINPITNVIVVEDSLTSTSTINALSANKGKELNDALKAKTDKSDFETLETFVNENVMVGGLAVSQSEKDTWNAKANNTLATDTENGLFSSAEKIKLASLSNGGGSSVVVEDVLTSNSTVNALSANQGRELSDALATKANQSDLETLEAYVDANVVVGGVSVTQTEKDTWSAKSNFSGSYNDLSNKPTIPNQLILNNTTSSTSTTEVATANAVKTAYDKGVEALTKANVVASTTVSGIVKLNNSTSSTSTTEAATANAVKVTYDLAMSKASTANFNSLITTSWTGTVAPFTQVLTINGMLASDTPFIFPLYSPINNTAIAESETWSLIGKISTGANTLTITCFEEKPTTALNIQIKVVR